LLSEEVFVPACGAQDLHGSFDQATGIASCSGSMSFSLVLRRHLAGLYSGKKHEMTIAINDDRGTVRIRLSLF